MAAASISKTDRAKGALAGALVADAATMGLHWIYDQAKIQALLDAKGKQSAPEFYEPPSCPFYQVGTDSTCIAVVLCGVHSCQTYRALYNRACNSPTGQG